MFFFYHQEGLENYLTECAVLITEKLRDATLLTSLEDIPMLAMWFEMNNFKQESNSVVTTLPLVCASQIRHSIHLSPLKWTH